MFREHLTCFPNVKNFTFFTLELVYQVGGFAIGKGGDGISEAGDHLSYRVNVNNRTSVGLQGLVVRNFF